MSSSTDDDKITPRHIHFAGDEEPAAAAAAPAPSVTPGGTKRSRPVHGILKPAPGGGSAKKKAARRVAWDEGNIVACEEGKDSVMRITEPKTPYNFGYMSQSDSDAEEMKAEMQRETQESLVTAMDKISAEIAAASSSSSASPSSAVAATETKQKEKSGWDSDEDMAGALAAAAPAGGGGDGEEDELQPQRTAEEHAAFERKRRQHYDEFLVMKLRLSGGMDEEDEDEDEEGEGGATAATGKVKEPLSPEGAADYEGGDEGDGMRSPRKQVSIAPPQPTTPPEGDDDDDDTLGDDPR